MKICPYCGKVYIIYDGVNRYCMLCGEIPIELLLLD